MATPSYGQPLLKPSKAKTTHKILFITLSLAALVTVGYVGSVIIKSNETNPIDTLSLCDKSLNPSSCLALINEALLDEANSKLSSNFDNGHKLLAKILSSHVSHITKAIDATKRINAQTGAPAVDVCLELMDLSRDRVANSIKALAKSKSNNNCANADISTWLSAVLSNHVTCLDELQNYSHELLRLKSTVENLISRESALLAIHAKISAISNDEENLIENPIRVSYPSWLTRSDRKLLEVSANAIQADVVVATDGSGKFKTVAEAVASAPDNGKKRYVIYVKKGVYKENVEVGKKKLNVMIVGDGMSQTVITGSLNVVDGATTFRSATLAAVGDGFILQDICIQNTAGPQKHQAVALRVGADKSVINRCKIDAYQDTLYAHSLRQFYTDSSITGTVDFIFGDAAVVLQKCKLIARKPLASQKNMVTAQGRTDPNSNTGTSIQYCDIIASSDLTPVQNQFPTFLGRPWQAYSRTVVMQSTIGGHVDPTGWSVWDGTFALNTLYYAEYKNTGPRADTSKRVNWKGYHVITNAVEAKKFTVGQFIQGQEWLDSAGVTYVEGL